MTDSHLIYARGAVTPSAKGTDVLMVDSKAPGQAEGRGLCMDLSKCTENCLHD